MPRSEDMTRIEKWEFVIWYVVMCVAVFCLVSILINGLQLTADSSGITMGEIDWPDSVLNAPAKTLLGSFYILGVYIFLCGALIGNRIVVKVLPYLR